MRPVPVNRPLGRLRFADTYWLSKRAYREECPGILSWRIIANMLIENFDTRNLRFRTSHRLHGNDGPVSRVDFRNSDIIGTFVCHCHLFEHEDGDKMGVIQIPPRC